MTWIPGEPGVPFDQELDGKIVTAIEAMSLVWSMVNRENDEVVAVPVVVLQFYSRDATTQTVVLSLGAVSSLMGELSEHLVSVLGGVGPIAGTITDEGLQQMIEDQFNKGDEPDRTDD